MIQDSMIEDDLQEDDQKAVRLHALRNALNTACIALEVGVQLLERGEVERAAALFADARDACNQCKESLGDATDPDLIGMV